MKIRIGQSADIHPLVAGRKLILGGVTIDHDRGLAGHSDGDALSHAVGEAILGALALGDLGTHFSDTDPKYEGADSLDLLRQIRVMMKNAGYRVGNVDATVLIEQPKLAPYKEAMRQNLAQALDTDIANISVMQPVPPPACRWKCP